MKRDIEGILKDTEVKLDDVGLLLRAEGIIIRLHFGGGKNSYSISPKAFGVKDGNLSEDSQEFIAEHIRNGSVTIVPKEQYKRLKAVESKTRKKLKELSTGVVFDNSYLTKDSFVEFLSYFEESKEEYFVIRDYLVENYRSMINRFQHIVKSSIVDMDAYAAEIEYERIMADLPSKDQFEESFKLDMVKTYFPAMNDLEGLDDVIKEQLKEQYDELGNGLVISSTANIIDEGISGLTTIFTSDRKNGKIHHQTRAGILTCVKRMGEINVFGNEKLEKIRNEIKGLLDLSLEEAIENSEVIMAELYVYSKELKIEKDINLSNCPLTATELEYIYNLYN